MKTLEDYNKSIAFALAMVGEPFVGKSTLAINFPDPYVIDCDLKLATALAHRPKDRWFAWDTPEFLNDGTPTPRYAKWRRLIQIVEDLPKQPDFDRVGTVILDSMTQISTYLVDHVIAEGGVKSATVGGEVMMQPALWHPYKLLMERLILKIKSYRKPCIFIFHEATDKDDITGQLNKRPLISGQLRDSITKLFTDSWRIVIRSCPVDEKHPDGIKRIARTVPDPLMSQLGSSANVPSEIEFQRVIPTEAIKQLYPGVWR